MYDTAGRGPGWKPGTVSVYLGHGVIRPGAHINRGLGDPGPPDPGEMPKFIHPVTPSPSPAPQPKPTRTLTPQPTPASTPATGTEPTPPALAATGTAAALLGALATAWIVKRRRRAR